MMRRNQARPFPPVNVWKYWNARSDASCRTSSASCSLRISQRASRRPAARCGTTTSSNVWPATGSEADGRSRSSMQLSDDLLQSFLQRRISEPVADPAETNVREHGVVPDEVRHDAAEEEPGRRRGHPSHSQRSMREACEHSGELVHPDRVAVHDQ